MHVAVTMALMVVGGLPAKPQPSDAAWSRPNAAATYVARQTAVGEGCHLEVVHLADAQVLWQANVCFGGRTDRVFLSPDGRRLIALATLPAARGRGAAHWRDAEVAWLFDRGALLGSARAGQLVKRGGAVRREVSHFSWLQGENGVPGVPPRYDDAGDAVELDAIDGTHATLRFSGFERAAPKHSNHPRKRRS